MLGGSSVADQRQCAKVNINLLHTYPMPARSTLLRRLCRSSAIVLSQWDEVCGKGYSYSHSSFQTMAFNSAAFSVSESKS